jgi:uncharacterized Ntn-hydrolase superfamily protein
VTDCVAYSSCGRGSRTATRWFHDGGDPGSFARRFREADVTFSICARERYRSGESAHCRFGVAVTTRLPAVGTLCPFASENGAVATQSRVNVELGRRGVEYVDDGLAVGDALEALLNADEGRAERQVHGVDATETFAFSGADCEPWDGHREGENYTVAGNLLTGPAVTQAVADTYEADRPPGAAEPATELDRGDGDGSDLEDGGCLPAEEGTAPFGERLIAALAAGHAEGGDKREALTVQSAALTVRTTESYPEQAERPLHHDLRVDASETPVADLAETYRLATEEFAAAVERYEE